MKVLAHFKSGYVKVSGTKVKVNKYPEISLAIHKDIEVDQAGAPYLSKKMWAISCVKTGLKTVTGHSKKDALQELNYRLDKVEPNHDKKFPDLISDALKTHGKADINNVVADLTK